MTVRSVARNVVSVFLLAAAASAAPPAALRVTLPDAGTYAYWVQSKSGVIDRMPITVTGRTQIGLPGDGAGGTLFVLDQHTGAVAAEALTGKPVTLTTGDFQPVGGTAAPPSPQAAVPPAPAPTPAAPETSGFGRLVTLVFGLLVAAGVGWVLLHLYRTRGQPLIDAARKLGVDVPDPAALPDEAPPAPVYTPPTPRAPDRIPDEAGVAPPARAGTAPPARPVGTLSAPQIVGTQGGAAGSVFVLPAGETVIGREGDNGIVLAGDTTVSRRHARLVHDGAGSLSITDEGSANGVYVNGSRVTQAALSGGDQIQIGDNHFRLET